MERIKLEESAIENRCAYLMTIERCINEIEMQRHDMMATYRIEPNKIILGRKIYEMLKRDVMCHKCSESSDNKVMQTIYGLPITVDDRNVYTIAVCFAFENNAEYFKQCIKDRF